jgi:hypothetical protein
MPASPFPVDPNPSNPSIGTGVLDSQHSVFLNHFQREIQSQARHPLSLAQEIRNLPLSGMSGTGIPQDVFEPIRNAP